LLQNICAATDTSVPSRIPKVFSAYPHLAPVFQCPFGIPFGCAKTGRQSNPIVMQQNLVSSELSEIQVSYKSKLKYSEMKTITTSKDAEEIFRGIWSNKMEFVEEFFMLLLNRANKVKGWYKVSEGGTTGTVVDPKVIFSVALKCHACGIMLAHNHPSGNTKPSQQDMDLTKKLVAGGKVLEINILDHLILSAEGYFSFADEGLT
jgi:DNA repair protein RadC